MVQASTRYILAKPKTAPPPPKSRNNIHSAHPASKAVT